jgi:hypothetical protein
MSESFRRFWAARGGPTAFEAWRLGKAPIPMLVVRVDGAGPDLVASFEIDDEVRRAAPALHCLLGMTETQVRVEIARRGWTATVTGGPNPPPPRAAHTQGLWPEPDH